MTPYVEVDATQTFYDPHVKVARFITSKDKLVFVGQGNENYINPRKRRSQNEKSFSSGGNVVVGS